MLIQERVTTQATMQQEMCEYRRAGPADQDQRRRHGGIVEADQHADARSDAAAYDDGRSTASSAQTCRSEERRDGKAGVSTCRSRCPPVRTQKKHTTKSMA